MTMTRKDELEAIKHFAETQGINRIESEQVAEYNDLKNKARFEEQSQRMCRFHSGRRHRPRRKTIA